MLGLHRALFPVHHYSEVLKHKLAYAELAYIFSAEALLLLHERQVILSEIITTFVTRDSAGFLIKKY